jgi:hypothetical protein
MGQISADPDGHLHALTLVIRRYRAEVAQAAAERQASGDDGCRLDDENI